jgi:hypothetical protein
VWSDLPVADALAACLDGARAFLHGRGVSLPAEDSPSGRPTVVRPGAQALETELELAAAVLLVIDALPLSEPEFDLLRISRSRTRGSDRHGFRFAGGHDPVAAGTFRRVQRPVGSEDDLVGRRLTEV